MSNHPRLDFNVRPGAVLAGRLQIPGDKSISHRALILGAVAEGVTHITGFLNSEDTTATLHAFSGMGVDIEQHDARQVSVHGVGLRGLHPPRGPLYLGNSGTSVRLLAGLLAGQAFDSELRGDASLSRRPMRRVTDPLQLMNADIRCSETGTLPILIRGGRALKGIAYKLPVASAQLKSSLLLAGLYASSMTCIREPAVTRDHTERMLLHFGCPVQRSGNQICISSHALTARDVDIPADLSSAAFFMVAASIVKGADLLLEGIGVNPSRHAVIEILRSMGADVHIDNERLCSGEPAADIRVRYGQLHGIRIPLHLVPIAIDEFPAILVAAAYARGETVLSGAAELRVKESDRIQAMTEGLTRLGVKVETPGDGMVVSGGHPSGGVIESHGDHRIAMAFTIAGLAAGGPVTIRDCANVDTSFPGFVDTIRGLGVDIELHHG
ncbi:MAG: 3-phosphoshikimate 1-carboxyvinyltransferase [Gammaproteobacteria bacterium]